MPIRDKVAESPKRVLLRLQRAGYEAYVVGGAVRDLLLERDPKDYDIATDATPEEVRKVFGRRSRIIGRRFKIVHVYADHVVYEVSTFRRQPDLKERQGRPEDSGLMVWRDNEYGTLEEDAWRRDFTVNALYFDPHCKKREIQDFVGGLADIENKIVRTIGDPDVRMAEDPVRMLRALKLVGQYGFTLDSGLEKAIVDGAEQITLSSQARLLEELHKILRRPYSLPIFEACQKYGLLKYLLPMLSEGWDSVAGRQTRTLLATRDQLMAENRIFASRISGLGGMVLPFIIERFKKHRYNGLWKNFSGVDKEIQAIVKQFLSPYLVPRYAVAKIRDILLVQPKLLEAKNRKRMLNHPEYNRSRDLFEVVVRGLELSTSLLDYWPPQQDQPKRRGRKKQ
jgi:poly(A) polymerase